MKIPHTPLALRVSGFAAGLFILVSAAAGYARGQDVAMRLPPGNYATQIDTTPFG